MSGTKSEAKNRTGLTRSLVRRGEDSAEGFGRFLSACLRYKYYVLERDEHRGETFSEFVDGVAKRAKVSPRHLARLRARKQIPDASVLEKLSVEIPLLKAFAEKGASLSRLSWEGVEADQDHLPRGSTITIVAGFVRPRALEDDAMAKRIAKNIFERDIKYAFVYPPDPSREFIESLHITKESADYDPEALMELLHGRTHMMIVGEFGGGVSDKEILERAKRPRESIKLFRTTSRMESLFFWGQAPRYLVLYNLFAPEASEYRRKQYGMFWGRGQLPYSDTHLEYENQYLPEPLTVQGWTYLTRSDYEFFSSVLAQDLIFTDGRVNEFKEFLRFETKSKSRRTGSR